MSLGYDLFGGGCRRHCACDDERWIVVVWSDVGHVERVGCDLVSVDLVVRGRRREGNDRRDHERWLELERAELRVDR